VTSYRVRLAAPADAEAICHIYNQGIEDRIATLETELRTPDERRQWLASRSPRHPVIVAEADSDGLSADPEPGRASLRPPSVHAGLTGPATIAWASLNVFNAREAYRHVADISVYVERAWRGQHGFHKLVLSAFPFNTGGMALYERLGYRTVGIYREQGRLDGAWVDTIIMEKLL
jgi:L-amino acid N-acyltransferase YncA